ncbi:hypothetical protein JZ751_018290 [Albula glossodonta]|uniref:Agouti-related protein n=1 Tax=Albula glossodonta TaxID=121402 RepID=A0A8T2NME8_9TELE|nr:hypothetical protein JZ751_018290 [Albula glossodonta]
MWSSVMFCWWVLCGVQVSVGAMHDRSESDEARPSPLRTVKEPSFLFTIEEDLLMDDSGLYNDEEDVPEAVQLQSRAVRSPRRCLRHGESCLGHKLPCCDPCDTCHCRFFHAICYCRRIGQACSPGRH